MSWGGNRRGCVSTYAQKGHPGHRPVDSQDMVALLPGKKVIGLRILGSVAGRLTTAFVVPLVVLGVVGLVAYLGTENLEQNSQRVDHTHQVLGALNSIETAIKDAEAGQRGFLLTDIDRYLDPYHYAAQTINSHLDRLTELTRDNPSQQERINALRPLVEARFSELHEAIELRRTQGREIALDLVRTNQGTDVTDKIRTIIIDLRAAEEFLLKERAEETAATATRSRTTILFGVALAVVLVGALSWATTRSVLTPLKVLTRRLTEIADGEGDLTQRVNESRRDEFGALGAVFNRFVDKLARAMRQIGEHASTLAAEASRLASASTQIANSAQQTSERATAVSTATDQMSSAVGTVATGTEEMSSSIREIAGNASEASRVVAEAVQIADSASNIVQQLDESSVEIGNVVKLITAIAEQTNLLALNATIEAARAGEAGKGFAVVASEVKDLAQETARATEDIGRRVESIQNDAAATARAISQMSEIVARVNEFQTSIASAVEEQATTTAEMTRTVNEASATTTQIAEHVSTVAAVADDTTVAVKESERTVAQLAEMSAALQRVVSQFKY